MLATSVSFQNWQFVTMNVVCFAAAIICAKIYTNDAFDVILVYKG